ncbi:MAG: hypothetical protein CME88_02315 [Hirschia sp.]|nr:hypothetical protein [Hirschia sp.]MBF17198.1 hypothetical protein [Hirschia sp.]
MEFSIADILPLILALIVAGAFAGLIAGLFGVGGGVVIVPALFFTLSSLGYPETAMHVSVGTSLATIVVTSVRSVMAHNKKDAVDWGLLRGWVPWIMCGALLGSFVANLISGPGLTMVFGGVSMIIALQFIFGRPGWRLAPDVPKGAPMIAMAGGIGGLSSILGIGGGVFGVTLLTLFGRPIHQAIGTSAGFGAAIGLPAAIGFAWNGRDASLLPPLSLGYLSLPGFILIAVMTTIFAPIGATLAHKLDAAMLKRAFGVLMVLTALNMLRKVYGL